MIGKSLAEDFLAEYFDILGGFETEVGDGELVDWDAEVGAAGALGLWSISLTSKSLLDTVNVTFVSLSTVFDLGFRLSDFGAVVGSEVEEAVEGAEVAYIAKG